MIPLEGLLKINMISTISEKSTNQKPKKSRKLLGKWREV